MLPSIARSLCHVLAVSSGLVRFTVKEINPKHARYPVQNVLQDAALVAFRGNIQFNKGAESTELAWETQGAGDSYESATGSAEPPTSRAHKVKLVVSYKPFRLTFSVDGVVTMLVNSDNLLTFEQFRERNPPRTAPVQPQPPTNMEGFSPSSSRRRNSYQLQLQQYQHDLAVFNTNDGALVWPTDTDGALEETHNGHTDRKNKGPAAIGLDIAFVNSKHVYGIPEHASSVRAQEHRGAHPAPTRPRSTLNLFRLYNLDVFEYELDEPMALYGAVPYVASHTVGLEQFSSGCAVAQRGRDLRGRGAEWWVGLFSNGAPAAASVCTG